MFQKLVKLLYELLRFNPILCFIFTGKAIFNFETFKLFKLSKSSAYFIVRPVVLTLLLFRFDNVRFSTAFLLLQIECVFLKSIVNFSPTWCSAKFEPMYEVFSRLHQWMDILYSQGRKLICVCVWTLAKWLRDFLFLCLRR